MILGLSVLYRYGPSRRLAKWRWLSVGSVFAALAWLAVSSLFSWYLGNFANYNVTYGALGAVDVDVAFDHRGASRVPS
jgi:membrane protein